MGEAPIGLHRRERDGGSVTIRQASVLELADRWDWRLSAHFRAVSLAGTWAMLLFASLLGPLAAPLLTGRFVLSGVQTALNFRLGRRRSLGPRPRLDWGLLVLTVACAYGAAAFGVTSLYSGHVLALLPMAGFYSLIQVRMCQRSYRASERERARLLRVPQPRYETELAEAA